MTASPARDTNGLLGSFQELVLLTVRATPTTERATFSYIHDRLCRALERQVNRGAVSGALKRLVCAEMLKEHPGATRHYTLRPGGDRALTRMRALRTHLE